ncbi:hypothetical protein FQV39_28335 [Bosea sp. F3-2]|uniref:hypothetical protein n=1 Tax=Bosea sp. F3-2 TaxID=2599640 RepID=UPI0011EE2EDE|nr:hypothetical protein [Bosea sp. F3-2]QEL26078.1 hypothetical protein FQV39_28335 [Bosea sp. F3-2]
MDQTEFRCETCWSPHVSIPDDLKPESEVLCGRCGGVIAKWSDFCGSISLAVTNQVRVQPAAELFRMAG